MCEPPPPSRIYSSLPEYSSFSTTIIFYDPPRNYRSLPEYIPFFNNYIRPPKIYPSLPELYTPPSTTIWDTPIMHPPPRIHPSPFQQLQYYGTHPESTPPSQNIPPFLQLYATHPEFTPPSQNLPPPPFKQLYTTLPESTPPSQNIPPFSTTIILWDPQLPESTLPPWIYPPPFSTTICDTPRIYPSLPEYFSVLGASCRFSHIYM